MRWVDSMILRKISATKPGDDNNKTKSQIYFSRLNNKLLTEVIDDLWEYSKMPEFYTYLEYPPFKSKKETLDYFKKLINYEDKSLGVCWILRLRKDNKAIGTFRLVYSDIEKKRALIGYGISPKYWYKGYFSEAMETVINYCFNVLELDRVEAWTRWDNSGSIKGLEKNGFKYEGRLRNYHLRYDGTRHDVVIYGLIKEDCYNLQREGF